MSTTATTQTWSVQVPNMPQQQMMIPADYVFIAIFFFAIGVWLGKKLSNDGAKSSRLLEGIGKHL